MTMMRKSLFGLASSLMTLGLFAVTVAMMSVAGTGVPVA
jgi:hypothetical protein